MVLGCPHIGLPRLIRANRISHKCSCVVAAYLCHKQPFRINKYLFSEIFDGSIDATNQEDIERGVLRKVGNHRMAVLLSIVMSLVLPGTTHARSPKVGNFEGFFQIDRDTTKRLVPYSTLRQAGRGAVRAVQFSPDGTYLATKVAGGEINIWNVRDKHLVIALPTATDMSAVTDSLLFSPDGRFLISSYSRDTNNIVATVWRVADWQVVTEIIDATPGDTTGITYSPDGNYLVRTVNRAPTVLGNTVVAVDTVHWKQFWAVRTVPFYPAAAVVTQDSLAVIIAGNVINPKQWRRAESQPVFGDSPMANASVLDVFSLATGQLMKTFNEGFDFESRMQLAHDTRSNNVAMASGEGLSVLNPDMDLGRRIYHSAPKYGSGTNGLAFIPGTTYLVEGAAHHDGTQGYLQLRDRSTFNIVEEIPLNVESLAVSSDGHFIATGLSNGGKIWQLQSRDD